MFVDIRRIIIVVRFVLLYDRSNDAIHVFGRLCIAERVANPPMLYQYYLINIKTPYRGFCALKTPA